MKLTLNGQVQVLEGFAPGMPLLWAIRDMAGRDAGHRSTNIGSGDAFCPRRRGRPEAGLGSLMKKRPAFREFAGVAVPKDHGE